VRASETTFRQTPKNARPTWALASIQDAVATRARIGATTRGTRTPALLPPTSSCQARRISPQAGVCLLRALACQRYALGVLVLQHEGPFSCCMLLRPAPTVAWQAGAGSLTRCFATPDPRATALAEPILAACVLLPLSPSLYAHDSTLRFCVCKVISGLSLSCQSVCLSSAVAHSAGLIRLGGFAVSTVAATPLH